MDIKLTFRNLSNDTNNSSVVIFQKNVAADFDEKAVAWTVIRNCGQNEYHPFTYPIGMTVSSSDSWGNYTPQLAAEHGQIFEATMTGSGDGLAYAGPATNASEIQVRNNLTQGAINAHIFKGGKLLAIKTAIAPGQRAAFRLEPTLWIGAASEIEEGDVMNSAVISSLNTELSLLGIASADIVMTGGGPGADSKPFSFHLENIKYA
ncbi:hypothetical protein H8L32_24160 [Undibacterium sp. CY18W]|uniref:Aromatic ring-opening dioxygenase LigA n=1 Tax=Undibacterium hunanense TaxID=2762292 RepID=A0ABR6ZXJ0_9BURK|nr:hypothetical protein [Undibacterium hunanense]MBC3920581.1 hypothetical protein [Undibacterium hunanense]